MKKRKAMKKSVTTHHAAPHQFDEVNGAKYLKNKVLVFKLRKKINGEMLNDKKEIKELTYLTRRARKIAA
ncbi:MAG: hypothetical protein KA715_14850 [Xanthomonadaceae bacterium]|nr:hypothetical protein [Xanthomonadaceae bacterium]